MDRHNHPLAVFTQNSNQAVKTPWMMNDDNSWEPVVKFTLGFPNTKNVVFWGEYSPNAGPLLAVDILEQIVLFKQYTFERIIPILQAKHWRTPIPVTIDLAEYEGHPLPTNAPKVSVDQITSKFVSIHRIGFLPIPMYPKYVSLRRTLNDKVFDIGCNYTNKPRFNLDISVIKGTIMEMVPTEKKSYASGIDLSEIEMLSVASSPHMPDDQHFLDDDVLGEQGDQSQQPNGLASESLDSTQASGSQHSLKPAIPGAQQQLPADNVSEEARIPLREPTDPEQMIGTGAPPPGIPSLSSASVHLERTQGDIEELAAAISASQSASIIHLDSTSRREVSVAELSAQCGSSMSLVPPPPGLVGGPSQPTVSTPAKKATDQKKKAPQITKKMLKAKRREEREAQEREAQRRELCDGHFEMVQTRVFMYLDAQRYFRNKAAKGEFDDSQLSDTEKMLLRHSNSNDEQYFEARKDDSLIFLEQRVKHHLEIGGDLDMLILRSMESDKGPTVLEDWTWLEAQSWKTNVDYATVERLYLECVKSRGRVPANQLERPLVRHSFVSEFQTHHQLYVAMNGCVEHFIKRQTLQRGFPPAFDDNPTYADIEKALVQSWRKYPGWVPTAETDAHRRTWNLECAEQYLNCFQRGHNEQAYNLLKAVARGLNFIALNDSPILAFDAMALKELLDKETPGISNLLYITEIYKGLKARADFFQ